MKKTLCALLLSAAAAFAGTIVVPTAANMSVVMVALKVEFVKNHPDTKVEIIYGASGKLAAQIIAGAPHDVFLSADMGLPEKLYRDKIAVTEPKVYAQGALAMFSIKGLDLKEGLKLLSSSEVQKIAIANPKTAPYGKAAQESFAKAGIAEAILGKLVFAESITQTVQFATTAADVGFVSSSTFFDPRMSQYREGTHWVHIDPSQYSPIQQGIVLLKRAENNPEAKAFVEFMLSPAAKSIIKNYGYLVP